nr:hypothetical protein BaRGS_005301 [Batillaria attramentaria]
MKMCGFGLLHILHDGEDRLSFNADKESRTVVVETPLTGSNSSTNRAAFSGHSSGKWLLSGYFHNKRTHVVQYNAVGQTPDHQQAQRTGDDRVNEHPALTLLHTILLRYHNYLATELRSLSPRSSSEIIFQQARAIVGAVMQNILFGHTLIPRSLPLSSTRRPLLRDIFFKPFEARENLDTLTEAIGFEIVKITEGDIPACGIS